MSADSGKLYPTLSRRADVLSIHPSADSNKASDRSDGFLQTLESLTRAPDRSPRTTDKLSAREQRLNDKADRQPVENEKTDTPTRRDRDDAASLDRRSDSQPVTDSVDTSSGDREVDNVERDSTADDSIDINDNEITTDESVDEQPDDLAAEAGEVTTETQPALLEVDRVIATKGGNDVAIEDEEADESGEPASDPAAELLAIATKLFGPAAESTGTESTEQGNVTGQAKQGDKPTVASSQQAALANVVNVANESASSADGEASDDADGENANGNNPSAFSQAVKPTTGTDAAFGVERAVAPTTVPGASGNEPGGGGQLAIAGATGESRASNNVQAARITIPLPSTGTPEGDANVARVARGLSSALSQNGGSVTLRLTPPEMGLVRIEMELNNGVIRAQLTAQSETARSLLGQQLSHLRQTLEAQGLSVDRLEVQTMNSNGSSGLADEQGDADGGQNDGRSQGRFERQPESSERELDESRAVSDFDSALEAQEELDQVNAVA